MPLREPGASKNTAVETQHGLSRPSLTASSSLLLGLPWTDPRGPQVETRRGQPSGAQVRPKRVETPPGGKEMLSTRGVSCIIFHIFEGLKYC